MSSRRLPSSQPRAVSIEDVASAASVSTATVSRVLNNPGLVASATAKRVQAAIDELEYRPNILAKGLSTRKTGVLGIALPDIFGEFYSELLRGADSEARASGYHLLVSSEARIGDGGHAESTLAFGLIDGLAVMITEPDARILPEAARSKVPVVVLDAETQGQRFDSVVVDNAVGTREAVHHLLESVGPAECLFVGGPRENFDTASRAAAFTAALAERGHRVRAEQLSFGTYTAEWGLKWATERLASRGTGRSCFGVLAGNDEIAYGVMQACQDAGVSIPGELRLIGCDDSRLASLVRPRLSSVRVPAAEIGAAAVRLLVRRVKEPNAAPTHLTLPTKLVIRESSVWRG
ncbi:MAG: LacI family DNA-binding transcriptional regulator [Phycisphaerae bacterium]|nr:LacI family DNA-binding transcriptional regulator [Phycisphaerae bacterium]